MTPRITPSPYQQKIIEGLKKFVGCKNDAEAIKFLIAKGIRSLPQDEINLYLGFNATEKKLKDLED